jgi:hypothetical protein
VDAAQVISLDPEEVRGKLRALVNNLEDTHKLGLAECLDDYDLLRFFHWLHLKGKSKDSVQAEIMETMVGRGLDLPRPKALHAWFIDFVNASRDILPDSPQTLVDMVVPKKESDIDLGEALANLYQSRLDLLGKLKDEVGKGPVLSYFDKFNKALDGVQGTVQTIMDYRHKRDVLEKVGTLHVQHSVDAAVQLVADLGDSDKLTLQAVGAGLLRALSAKVVEVEATETTFNE